MPVIGTLSDGHRVLEAAARFHSPEARRDREFLKVIQRGDGDVTVSIHRLILLPTVAPSFDF